MIIWNQNIWRKYICSFNNDIIPSLLIMDQATIHTNQEVISEFECNDTELQLT